MRDRQGLQICAFLWTKRRRTAENTAPDVDWRRSRIRRAVRDKSHFHQATKYDGSENVDLEIRFYGEAGNLPHWGYPENHRGVSISGFRKRQVGGEMKLIQLRLTITATGPRELGRYRVMSMSEVRGAPVDTGAVIRQQFPHSEERAMLLLHNPWREADDIRAESADSRIPKFGRFLESVDSPLTLRLSVENAQEATRAQRTNGKPCAGRSRRSCRLRRGGPPRLRTPGRRRRRLRPRAWRFSGIRRKLRLGIRVAKNVGGRFLRRGGIANLGHQQDCALSIRLSARRPSRRKGGEGTAPRPVRRQRREAIPNRVSSAGYRRMGSGNPRVQTDPTSHRRRIRYSDVLRYPIADRAVIANTMLRGRLPSLLTDRNRGAPGSRVGGAPPHRHPKGWEAF